MHTGGPKVLEATATALGITEKDLEASWECLRKVGNISSTSVLLSSGGRLLAPPA